MTFLLIVGCFQPIGEKRAFGRLAVIKLGGVRMNRHLVHAELSSQNLALETDEDSFLRSIDSLGLEPAIEANTEWFLGYDGTCSRCVSLQDVVADIAGLSLATISLHDPLVAGWRRDAFGDNPPWAPTLFRVKDGKVDAWVGKKLAIKLATVIGPRKAWLLANRIAETAADFDPKVHREMDRRGFVKGLAAVAAGLALVKTGQENSLAGEAGITAHPSQCGGLYSGYEDYGSRVLAITSNCRVCPDGAWVTDVYAGNTFYYNYSAAKVGPDGIAYRWYHSSGPAGCWVRGTQFT